MSPTRRAQSRAQPIDGPTSGPIIGILGGSFDPVHRGHLLLAERARDQVPCDEVWLVPAAIAPHKPDGAQASPADRLAMLARAVEGRRGLRIETLELDAGVPRRTIETLRLLAARHPHLRWRLVLGADSWSGFDAWVQPEALLDLAPAVVQARPGIAAEEPAVATDHPAHWLTGDPLDVSSTEVRAALARGESPASIPIAVLDYIRARGLYRARGEERSA